MILTICGMGFACASTVETNAAPPTDPAQIPERIEAVRLAIEDDHARLETLIRQSPAESPAALHENPELAALADRIERHRVELARLMAQQAAASE
jgi:hypothetical protein